MADDDAVAAKIETRRFSMWTLEVNLNDLYLFVQAVDAGSMSAAARRLDLPKSTVSKRVAELERTLGARLVHRTSRSFRLTPVGAEFFEHARAAVIEAESARDAVLRQAAEPAGVVRITSSVPVAQHILAPCLPALAIAHPKLLLQIHASDRLVDIAQEGFDIAVRSHFAPLPDSALVQRPLAASPIVVVAAPAYLARAGTPDTPADLARHDGLHPGPQPWRLQRLDDASDAVDVTPRLRLQADESTLLLQAATAGLGLACLPDWIAGAALASGTLVRVLPGWCAGTVTTTLLMPHRRGQLPGVRAAVEFLAQHVARRHRNSPDDAHA
ncbi:LysR family transcriptional regulator [Burkholderia sp. NRF60-BP8]|uniref:LysR family transcriptional regulator n=1 Tax=Burkholderia sp. NRF60-BP8 TaxID=1637853 RepID=UPI0007525D64|nr:LysR family transcriptional regulator [Burkholderia sp. NRF60-BP8]AOI77382.1 LysR family transcriptional regulator [Burkholderia sp. NRF60-BP8]KVA15446.1 LysR family transcriptional regulator [Burkholderia sp. NRF60-BP8]